MKLRVKSAHTHKTKLSIKAKAPLGMRAVAGLKPIYLLLNRYPIGVTGILGDGLIAIGTAYYCYCVFLDSTAKARHY